MLLLDVGLFAGLAVADKAYNWGLIDLPWWAWLLLASPALILMVLLLVVPLADVSPGRLRTRCPRPLSRSRGASLLVSTRASELRRTSRTVRCGGIAASP